MATSEKVKEIIADALFTDVTNLTADARLIGDLGAESIDFLDIMFRLEQEFGIKLSKADSENKLREGLKPEEVSVGGVMQEKGLERLRQIMPEVDCKQIAAGLLEKDIPTLYTVNTFIRMVEEKTSNTVAADVPTAGRYTPENSAGTSTSL